MFILQESRDLPHVTFLRLLGKPTDDELETYIEEQRVQLAKGPLPKVAMVMELKEVWTSRQRRMMRDFELEMQQKAGGQNVGMALVVPNSLIRGAFTAYFWLAPPDYPTKMVPSAVEASDWIRERLEEAGLPASSDPEFRRVATSYWPARRAVPGRGLIDTPREELAVLLGSAA